MAENKYPTIQQHQPLRVPVGWDKQEKALVVQLDELFDDIYKRFGRLRMEDMGKSFQQTFSDLEGNVAEISYDIDGLNTRFETVEGDVSTLQQTATELTTAVRNAEGDISTLQQTAGELTILVSNKYDKVSGIDIVADGVEISGSKYVKIKSGGSFEVESGKFNIDTQGNATFGGSLDGADGTFKGTVTANGVIACNIDAGKITSGTLDCGNLTVSNLSASDVHGGTIDATDVTITNLDAQSIVGGTIDASVVTVTNLDAAQIKTGTMSADYIRGGGIDATNVTITNLDAASIVGGTIDARNVTITNLDASQIKSGTMSAGYIEGGVLTLGGNNNESGLLQIENSSGAVIGSWGMAGIVADVGTFGGSLDAVNGTFTNLNAGQWQFDSSGAHVKVGNYNMGIGDKAGSRYTDGGIYFNIYNGTPPAGRSAVQSQIELLAKSPDNVFATAVMLECLKHSGGSYTGAFYQVASTGAAGVSLGKRDNPWFYSYLDTVYGTTHLHFYPDKNFTSQFIQMALSISGELILDAYGAATRKLGQPSQPWTEGYISDLYYDNLHQNSSREVKHNILDMEAMGDTLDRLRPVTFAYNKDPKEKKRYGLIYEEAIDVLPEVCADEDQEKGINYMELVPMLLKEIQDLRKRVQDLEERCRQCTM
jgi:hypothetical protein